MSSVKIPPVTRRRWVVCIPATVDERDLLELTLPAVLANTSASMPIVLLALDGDSETWQSVRPPTGRIQRVLAQHSADLWPAALRELPEDFSQHDLLLLRPGIEPPFGWDTRLALAMDRDSAIAAAVPLCDSLPLIALGKPATAKSADLPRIDALLRAYSLRQDFEIPILFSGCCYLHRAALRAIDVQITAQPAMTVSDWSQWLARTFRERGWGTIACDHLYVFDHAPERRQPEITASNALEDVRLMERAHPLFGLRKAIGELLDRSEAPAPIAITRKPVQLHVAHSWGGGLDYWVRQYCGSDQGRDNLVLRSIGTWGAFGQRIGLYRSASMDRPLRYWDLGFPIRATVAAHLQYQAILREIIADFRIEAMLISSLVGHSLDALATGLPTVIVAHDYYPFCPAVVIYFGEVCNQCPRDRLAACFAHNDQNRFFRNANADEWLNVRRRFSQLAQTDSVHFIAPSPAVIRHWQILMPELGDQQFTVIPHGLDFAPPRLPEPSVRDKLRVVVLGSLAPQKGRALLEQLWPLIADQVELYLVGCDEDGDIFCNQPGITVIPHFRHAELAEIMAGIQPEVGLLLSVWPETFSYTLSELWLFGLPVVAVALGSFADRITEGVNGFLCPPHAEMIAARLHAIAADRTCLQSPRQWAANFRHRSIAEMIADYHALIPLSEFSPARYFAPPGELPTSEESPHALHVDTRVPFSQVLREFGDYAGRKLADTPRLRSWQKRSLATVLRLTLRGATRLTRIPIKRD